MAKDFDPMVILDQVVRDEPREALQRTIADATRRDEFPEALTPGYEEKFKRMAHLFRRLQKRGLLKIHGLSINDPIPYPNQSRLSLIEGSHPHIRLTMHPQPLTWLSSRSEILQGLRLEGERQVIITIVGTVRRFEIARDNAIASRKAG